MKEIVFACLILIIMSVFSACLSTTIDTNSPPTITTTSFAKTTPNTLSTTKAPQIMTGHGDDVRSFTATGIGLIIFTIHHEGSDNFYIFLKNSKGDLIAGLVNNVGPYSGRTSEKVVPGVYYLDIHADGDWSIEITPV